MHVAMVQMDGEKMSKSLGNLVFVRDLLTEWDASAVRLCVLAHHYRVSWEWNSTLMPTAADRLELWRKTGSSRETVLDAVREALDDDLDTPKALALIDAAANNNEAVTMSAALLGVVL
jgi:L-cysteine:1D-myo-inositol 2-amino-2-deoxy-alpha-D-glucopyranoside ligase